MNYIEHTFDWLKANPAVLAILFGTLASWAGATLLEGLFVPTTWTKRAAQQVTVIANVTLGISISYPVWRAMSPQDPGLVDFAISATCALISPFSYVWVAKALTHFFPWIGSVWAIPEESPTMTPASGPPKS